VTDRASTSNGDASPRQPDGLDAEESVLTEVRRALRQIEFGSIVIKIHQGKVVGLETSTKLRLHT
jgi:hypothetical protein